MALRYMGHMNPQMAKPERPNRKYIPLSVKRAVANRQRWVCKCGCGAAIENGKVHWDHEPALRLRDVSPDGSDYIPPQNDPDYIDALCPASHHAKTHGTGASTAGTDIGKIKKERKRNKPQKLKTRIPARGFSKPPAGYNFWTKRIER